ncbi:MAG: hypothetical protein EOM19_06555 [Candidatus Moranbacteria bacterium]|nr:hypothetical protein [Candidatus Moranbacteria bacterium]
MFSKFFAILISASFLSGCITTPEQAGYVGGSALSGALIGSLAGAALSPKGDGRRSDAAVRGAMGGAAVGTLAGMYGVSQPQGRGGYQGYPHQGGGTTRCSSRRTIDSQGRVSETETCSSSETRGGYRNY